MIVAGQCNPSGGRNTWVLEPRLETYQRTLWLSTEIAKSAWRHESPWKLIFHQIGNSVPKSTSLLSGLVSLCLGFLIGARSATSYTSYNNTYCVMGVTKIRVILVFHVMVYLSPAGITPQPLLAEVSLGVTFL